MTLAGCAFQVTRSARKISKIEQKAQITRSKLTSHSASILLNEVEKIATRKNRAYSHV